MKKQITKNNSGIDLNLAVDNINVAQKKLHSSAKNILLVTQKIDKLAHKISDPVIKKHLHSLITSLYEYSSFEDIVSQHLQNALSIIDGKSINRKNNDLLNGPALSKGDGLSQDEIDKMMNGE